MNNLIEQISTLKAGIYWLPHHPTLDDQKELAKQEYWICYYIEGSLITTEQQLMDSFKTILRLADYSNNNLDAFRDGLRNVELNPRGFQRYIIFYNNYHILAKAHRQRFDLIVQDVFWASTDNWVRHRPFRSLNILLFGDKSCLSELITVLNE